MLATNGERLMKLSMLKIAKRPANEVVLVHSGKRWGEKVMTEKSYHGKHQRPKRGEDFLRSVNCRGLWTILEEYDGLGKMQFS